MKEVSIKQFEGKDVRHHLDESGQVWFVSKDVMEVLGIKSQAHALRKLDDDQRGEAEFSTLGGIQKYATVSESGLYDLTLQSHKPSARPFQRWVTKEVLPGIRKTGTYSIQNEDPRVATLRALLENTQKLVEHEKKLAEQETITNELKAENIVLHSRVTNVDNTVTQLMRHRKGADPIPYGLITLKRLTVKYFAGVAEPVVSDYLRSIDHKTEPYTYIVNDVEYSAFCFVESGLLEAANKFFNSLKLVNETPKNIRVNHKMIRGNFWLNKNVTPINIQNTLLNKLIN